MNNYKLKEDAWKKVYDFWFNPENAPLRFAKNSDFDKKIYDNFYEIWKLGKEGMLFSWRNDIKGRLSEIVVLDQFSRNLCRDKPCAFEQDSAALVLAQEAVTHPGFSELSQEEKIFVLMPFMHSESKLVHEQALDLFTKYGDNNSIDYEIKHKRIIDRFGRYPHRNKVLNRESTKEEIEFLKEPDSSF